MQLEKFRELQSKGELRCRKCDSPDLFFTEKPAGFPHFGEVRCKLCHQWFDWVARPKKDPAPPGIQPPLPIEVEPPQEPPPHIWGSPPAKEKSPRFTPAQLAHPQTLLERVAALEHDVSVLAQLLIGKING
jgi:hypothetical protein